MTVVDKNIYRSAFTKTYSADLSLTNVNELERDHYYVVIDANGVIPVMSKTLDYVRHGVKVLLFGVPPSGQTMSIEPFIIFRKGLTQESFPG